VCLALEQPNNIGIHCRSNLSKSKLCKYCVPLPWPQYLNRVKMLGQQNKKKNYNNMITYNSMLFFLSNELNCSEVGS